MGLALCVGELASFLGTDGDTGGVEWCRGNLHKLNEFLQKNGRPEHNEPEVLAYRHRWRVEAAFFESKQLLGLPDPRVRTGRAWSGRTRWRCSYRR